MSMITEQVKRLREAADFRHTIGDYMTAGLHREAANTIEQLAAKVRKENGLRQEPCEDMGEVSDGYHTFNQLYYQRAVLFATIVNQNKDKSWKSFKHSDGNYCFDSNGEWFIVGIDTPQGNYTYHYAKEYWDMFDCEELECGKEWDGHTEEDVTRLLSLEQEPCEEELDFVQEHKKISCNLIVKPCEDCISREPFTDSTICEGISCNECSFNRKDKGGCILEERVMKLPPVNPQTKTGHWIFDEILDKHYYCSECKSMGVDYWDFCPNCGAKMIEPQESEDKECR